MVFAPVSLIIICIAVALCKHVGSQHKNAERRWKRSIEDSSFGISIDSWDSNEFDASVGEFSLSTSSAESECDESVEAYLRWTVIQSKIRSNMRKREMEREMSSDMDDCDEVYDRWLDIQQRIIDWRQQQAVV